MPVSAQELRAEAHGRVREDGEGQSESIGAEESALPPPQRRDEREDGEGFDELQGKTRVLVGGAVVYSLAPSTSRSTCERYCTPSQDGFPWQHPLTKHPSRIHATASRSEIASTSSAAGRSCPISSEIVKYTGVTNSTLSCTADRAPTPVRRRLSLR